MAIPDYQALMLPLLKRTSDQKEHRFSEIEEALANEFRVSSEERLQMLPSGRQQIFKNRITWAVTYLRKAKLLENTGRGIYIITPTGLDLLSKNLPKIDNTLLRQFEDFENIPNQTSTVAPELQEEVLDPVEALDKSYQVFNRTLSDQLLETVKQSTPAFFERLVVDLLLSMGYGGSHQDILDAVRGRTGDEGIDGVIKEDPLGLEEIYIQAKRYNNTVVGRPTVQAFAGSMVGFYARKGVFLTTSSFSQEAYAYVQKIDKKIVLIDGQELVQLMIQHNVGVTNKQTYTLKQIDLDYFEIS